MYGLMHYWDDDPPDWGDDERAYAAAWRRHPKWVVSSTMTPADLGPNATLVTEDLEAFLRRLKADVDGEIEVGGPLLASGVIPMGLIDEYQIYLHPAVVGEGKPFFLGVKPPELRLMSTEQLDDNVILLTYVPA